MPNYKLTYFNGRGRAELIRLIFAQAGVEYEDNRIVKEQWMELKPNTPWGGLPLLEVDGKKIGQSMAIARYIAREHGLGGETSIEQCMVDSCVDAVSDILLTLTKAHFEKDPDKKKEQLQKIQTEEFPKVLRNFDRFLCANNGGAGFLVGNKVTWADIALFSFYETVVFWTKTEKPFEAKGFPKVEALVQRVAKLPNIAKWLKNRPQTEF